ncbi:Lipase [Parasponia andersonii]|uniref:Lipase n=1 Tax=Parasponia andersonii TaxID=3476 RepID=A0A2P5C0P7_PARAD|nr:Lipase [Parasponia andersonii]
MDCSDMKKIWLVVIALCVVSNTHQLCYCANAKPQVPCFFIFGDSLSDGGNNNKLSTWAKVNYPPYGIDYPNGPTGRFCNGRTTVDILAEYLGFNNSIPAFASSKGFKIREGVNYASGSAGILKRTGRHMGVNISLRKQLKYHRMILTRLADKFGSKKAAIRHLNKCLYWVGTGSNDYINNYFSPQFYSTSSQYNPEQFATLLIEQYRHHIMRLYKYGATKVALVGLGRIGCTPNSLALHKTNGSHCVDHMNNAVQYFNVKLLTLVDQLNTNLTNAKFIYINTYGMGGGDPTAAGFKVWDVGCCPVNNVGQCVPLEKPCENRRDYVFWDSFHPTEAINMITASRIYNAYDLSDSYPMDVNKLVQLSMDEAIY